MRTTILAIGAVACLSGCAIHPDTEDFSRDILPVIVHKVRCEAQDSILKVIPGPGHPLMDTVIVYEFEFELTENNDASVGGAFVIPINWGALTIGYSAGGARERQTTQKVKFADEFNEIVKLDCGPLPRRNYKYPITGAIGLITTFENYVTMAHAKKGDDLQDFTDEIKFTTTLSASLKPSVELAPRVGRKISVDAELSVQRKDQHKVVLGFDAPTTPAQAAAAQRRKLAALRWDRSVPLRVQLVGRDGQPIDPRTVDKDAIPQVAPGGPPPPAGPPAASSSSDRKRRAIEKFDYNQQIYRDRRILERLR